jgi:hypothetical protein
LNFLHATMPVWVCIVFVVALSILVAYMAFVAARNARATESIATSKQEIIDTRTQERDKLNTENANLSEALEKTRVLYNNILAQNADLREALQEAQAEIKALQMNTIEVQEVAPVKRTTRKPKAGAS